MGKVNKCMFTFFSSADWKDSLKKWNQFVQKKEKESKLKSKKTTPNALNTEIAAYFDEIDDEYRVCIVGTFGDVIRHSVYSWDELSQLIHDNL